MAGTLGKILEKNTWQEQVQALYDWCSDKNNLKPGNNDSDWVEALKYAGKKIKKNKKSDAFNLKHVFALEYFYDINQQHKLQGVQKLLSAKNLNNDKIIRLSVLIRSLKNDLPEYINKNKENEENKESSPIIIKKINALSLVLPKCYQQKDNDDFETALICYEYLTACENLSKKNPQAKPFLDKLIKILNGAEPSGEKLEKFIQEYLNNSDDNKLNRKAMIKIRNHFICLAPKFKYAIAQKKFDKFGSVPKSLGKVKLLLSSEMRVKTSSILSKIEKNAVKTKKWFENYVAVKYFAIGGGSHQNGDVTNYILLCAKKKLEKKLKNKIYYFFRPGQKKSDVKLLEILKDHTKDNNKKTFFDLRSELAKYQHRIHKKGFLKRIFAWRRKKNRNGFVKKLNELIDSCLKKNSSYENYLLLWKKMQGLIIKLRKEKNLFKSGLLSILEKHVNAIDEQLHDKLVGPGSYKHFLPFNDSKKEEQVLSKPKNENPRKNKFGVTSKNPKKAGEKKPDKKVVANKRVQPTIESNRNTTLSCFPK
ncbi:MAG: hypothetical protein PVI75_05870 [Gammaproteobacteria bacterium]|jgi:hypothetical protein